MRRAANGTIQFTSPFFDPEAVAQRNRLVDVLGGRASLQTNETFLRDEDLSSNAIILNHQFIFGAEDRGRLMAGLRFDDFENRLITRTSRSESSTRGTSPSLGASYRIVHALTAYALYSRSIKPNVGGQPVAPQITPLANGALFDPEYGEGLDIGVKFESERWRTAGTLALFSVMRENIVRRHPDIALSDLVEAATGQTLSEQSGRERNRGLEMDFVIRPTKRWQVYGGFTWLADSEVLSSEDPATVGKPVAYAREFTGSLWNKVDLGPRFYVSGGLTYKTQPEVRFAENSDSEHTRIDVSIGYKAKIFDVATRFELQVKNVTDKLIYETFDVRDYPRRWIASVRAEF